MAITLTHQLLVKWGCYAKQYSLLHLRLSVVVVPWVRDSRLWPEQLLADRLQLFFGQQTGFQGGFAVALLAGCNNDVQVSRHCSWHPLLFFARIRSSVTVGNIGGRLPGAFLLVPMMLDQLTKTFDGISIEL